MRSVSIVPTLIGAPVYAGISDMKWIFLILTLFCVSAHAELFVCNGEGRFVSVKSKQVEITPQNPEVEVFRNPTDTVTLSLDDANSDGTHYLRISDQNADGHTRILKASRRDMVMYIDQIGQSPPDIIACLPIPGS